MVCVMHEKEVSVYGRPSRPRRHSTSRRLARQRPGLRASRQMQLASNPADSPWRNSVCRRPAGAPRPPSPGRARPCPRPAGCGGRPRRGRTRRSWRVAGIGSTTQPNGPAHAASRHSAKDVGCGDYCQRLGEQPVRRCRRPGPARPGPVSAVPSRRPGPAGPRPGHWVRRARSRPRLSSRCRVTPTRDQQVNGPPSLARTQPMAMAPAHRPHPEPRDRRNQHSRPLRSPGVAAADAAAASGWCHPDGVGSASPGRHPGHRAAATPCRHRGPRPLLLTAAA